MTWKLYRRKSTIIEMQPYETGMSLAGVSISESDAANGSPRIGDMVARNPMDFRDRWLVAEKYFKEHYEEKPNG